MKKSVKIIMSVLCVAVIIGACFAFVACNPQKSGLEDGVLNVATELAFDPFEYIENGVPTGIDIDIMAAIAEELGVKLNITDMDFDAVVAAAGSGTHDIAAAGLTITPERLEAVDFTQSYFKASQVVIAPAGDPILALTSVEEVEAALAGKKIGAQKGTTGYFYAAGDPEEGVAGITDFDKAKDYVNGAAAVSAMLSGQVDYVIIDAVPAAKLVHEFEDTAVSEVVLTEEQYAFAVRKGNKELLEKVEAALTKLIEDGTIKAIFDSYGVDNEMVA